MIEIDVVELEKLISGLENEISDYEKNVNQINFQYKEIKNHWSGKKSNDFFKIYDDMALDQQKLLTSLRSYLNLYKYVYNNYQTIGEKISCDITQKDFNIEKINNNILNLEKIINKYNNLGDISFYNKSSFIKNEQERIRKLKETQQENLKIIKDKYNHILGIEKEVKEQAENIYITQINNVIFKD